MFSFNECLYYAAAIKLTIKIKNLIVDDCNDYGRKTGELYSSIKHLFHGVSYQLSKSIT